MKKPTIEFTIETKELKEAIKKYALSRGFNNVASLSRVALFELSGADRLNVRMQYCINTWRAF